MSTFQGEVTQASRGRIRDTSNSRKIHFGAGWLHIVIKGNDRPFISRICRAADSHACKEELINSSLVDSTYNCKTQRNATLTSQERQAYVQVKVS